MEAAIPLLFYIVYYNQGRGSLLLCHFGVFLWGTDSGLRGFLSAVEFLFLHCIMKHNLHLRSQS